MVGTSPLPPVLSPIRSNRHTGTILIALDWKSAPRPRPMPQLIHTRQARPRFSAQAVFSLSGQGRPSARFSKIPKLFARPASGHRRQCAVRAQSHLTRSSRQLLGADPYQSPGRPRVAAVEPRAIAIGVALGSKTEPVRLWHLAHLPPLVTFGTNQRAGTRRSMPPTIDNALPTTKTALVGQALRGSKT